MILYGNDIDDDSKAIRGLFNGFPVLDTRLEVDIVAPTIWDLPPGLYRVKIPSRWPFDPAREGMGRRRPPSIVRFTFAPQGSLVRAESTPSANCETR